MFLILEQTTGDNNWNTWICRENQIGDAGASGIGEGLKELRQLKSLILAF